MGTGRRGNSSRRNRHRAYYKQEGPHSPQPDERLDELHWVLGHHVHHLGRISDEIDRLILLRAAKDSRQPVAIRDRR
jgi:hypothetical protein